MKIFLACFALQQFFNIFAAEEVVNFFGSGNFNDNADFEGEIAIETDQAALAKFSIVSVIKGSKCNKKPDRNFCWVKCEQIKLGYKDHCCRCNCRRGYVLKKDGKGCEKVTWSKWNAWSSCLETEWGGLQTRKRSCKSKQRTEPGKCVGAGSQSKKCSKVTKHFFLRKNLRKLTEEETQDLIQAMIKFKKDRSLSGYDNIVGWHGWPFRCPWNKQYEGHKNGHCSFHSDLRFLTWHRLIVVQLERGLNRYMRNKSMGIPYWDWTDPEWTAPPQLLTNLTLYDKESDSYVDNPFRHSLIRGHKPVKNITGPLYSQRSISVVSYRNQAYFLRGLVRALTVDSYYYLDTWMEDNPHNIIHNCFCYNNFSSCNYGMPTVNFAAWDPAFMFHHSQIDRLYVLRRRLREDLGIQDWTRESIFASYLPKITKENTTKEMRKSAKETFRAINMPLSPFCNASMNPDEVTLRANDVLTSYYGKQLFGFEYDSLDLGERNWRLLLVDTVKLRQRENWDEPGQPFVSALGRDLGVVSKASTKLSGKCPVKKYFVPAT